MLTARSKFLSWQAPVIGLFALFFGLLLAFFSRFSGQWMVLLSLALAFPFVALISGNVRRFLLFSLCFTLPIQIDVNFIHLFEEQAGASTMGVALRDIFVLLMLGYGIIQSAKKTVKPAKFYTALAFPAVLYFEAALLSLLWAPRLDLATLELVQMAKVMLLFWVVAYQLQDQRDLELCCWALALALGGQSLIALMQYISGNTLGLAFLGEMQIEGEMVTSLQRVGGTLGHPNRLSWFLEILLPLTLGLVLLARTRIAWYTALVSFILGCSAMILTGSRGGWISTLVALTFFMVIAVKCHRMQSRQVFQLALFSAVVLVIVSFLFTEQLENRIFGDDHGSAMGRIPTFQIAFNLIQDNPVGGVGINNYAVVMRKYNDTILGMRFSTIRRPVHNMYLLITGETGLIGLAAFLFLIFSLVRCLWRSVHSPNMAVSIIAISLLSGILAFLLHGFVDKHPPGGYPLFYIILALTAVLPEAPAINGQNKK
ncbi:MAG TPA: O-antigen ligase family protein [bacterium]|nr:O-antigen ligase family protein [bacterium]HNT65175.1 O-antigen ligase family protein [bacterium]